MDADQGVFDHVVNQISREENHCVTSDLKVLEVYSN